MQQNAVFYCQRFEHITAFVSNERQFKYLGFHFDLWLGFMLCLT